MWDARLPDGWLLLGAGDPATDRDVLLYAVAVAVAGGCPVTMSFFCCKTVNGKLCPCGCETAPIEEGALSTQSLVAP